MALGSSSLAAMNTATKKPAAPSVFSGEGFRERLRQARASSALPTIEMQGPAVAAAAATRRSARQSKNLLTGPTGLGEVPPVNLAPKSLLGR